jgi:hypothetical protein
LREECRLRVFENKVLRRIFGPKRDEVTGEWRRVHKEELYVLYSSSNIIQVIKSKRVRWTEHVARMGKYRCIQGFSGEDRGVDWRIILKWISRSGMGERIGSIWLRTGTGGGLL